MNLSPYAMLLTGLLIGTGITIVSMPPIMTSKKCETFRVSNRVATSYALKPPPAPPAEKVVVKEACVTKTPENDTQPELSNTDDTQTKPRHHRRHHGRYI